MDLHEERALRIAIFDRLSQIVDAKGGALTRSDLADFEIDGRKLPLIDRNRGIRNPQSFRSTLSILSKPDSPYADEIVGESLFAYDYREGRVDAGDNVKLRNSFVTQLPLILLRWIKVGEIRYIPVFPVYVVADDPDKRRIILALDERLRDVEDPLHLSPLERRYAQRVTKMRLHQPQFRSRVMLAYSNTCAICRLARPQLLEAAHIIADNEQHATADINNGLSLCKIHHAAYDRNLLGISPDFRIHVGAELMSKRDEGPILRYALQDLDGAPLTMPTNRNHQPSRDSLAERFDQFRGNIPSVAATDSTDVNWARDGVANVDTAASKRTTTR